MAEAVDSILLIEVLREVRQELRDHRTLLLDAIDQGRSLEHHVDVALLAITKRVDELQDDLEVVIKSELMGLVNDLDPRGPRR
jgi:hypothetical protein